MSNSRKWIIGLALVSGVAIIIGAYLYYQNKKKDESLKKKDDDLNNKDEEINQLKQDNLKLILDSLKHNNDFSNEIKLQIEKLIQEFEYVDEKVSNELAQALQLFQIGQPENAIEDLVKIIEHLLNEHYKESVKYKEWIKSKSGRKNDLHNMLEFCKEEKKINQIEYHFYMGIKTIRNKEDHTLDLKLDEYLNISGLLTGIGGIFKLSKIVYSK